MRLQSCPRLASVGIEQLLAVDLIAGDVFLPLGRDEVIDKLLAQRRVHIRMFPRVDQHHPVLIEESFVALDDDLQVSLIPEMDPRGAIGQYVGIGRPPRR